MNQALADALAQATNQLLAWINAAGKTIEEQAPAVVAEIMRWGRYQDYYWLTFASVIGLSALGLRPRLIRWGRKEEWDEVGPVFSMAGLVLALGWSLAVILVCVQDLWFMYAAPRLYLLQAVHLCTKG